MRVEVRFFASLRDRVGAERVAVEVADGCRVRDLWARFEARAPDAVVLAAVNARHAPMDRAVRDGDEVAFFPPVTGG